MLLPRELTLTAALMAAVSIGYLMVSTGGPAASSLDHSSFGFSLATHRATSSGRSFARSDCHSADSFTFEATRCESCHREYQPDFVEDHVAV